MKIYKYRGWARRAAAKKKWHCVDGVCGGFVARPMTDKEIKYKQQLAAVERIELDTFAEQIPALLNTEDPLYRLLRKPA